MLFVLLLSTFLSVIVCRSSNASIPGSPSKTGKMESIFCEIPIFGNPEIGTRKLLKWDRFRGCIQWVHDTFINRQNGDWGSGFIFLKKLIWNLNFILSSGRQIAEFRISGIPLESLPYETKHNGRVI